MLDDADYCRADAADADAIFAAADYCHFRLPMLPC